MKPPVSIWTDQLKLWHLVVCLLMLGGAGVAWATQMRADIDTLRGEVQDMKIDRDAQRRWREEVVGKLSRIETLLERR